MKKIIIKTVSLALVLTAVLSLCSCSAVPYDYELEEYLELTDYTKIQIEESLVPLRAAQYKNDLISAHSVKSAEPLFARRHKEGDIAVISYKCYTEEALAASETDDTVLPSLEDVNTELIIGRGRLLPAIESAILNTESFTVPLELHMTLPADFGYKTLAGKNVVFFITVHAVYELIPPVYDNVFISENTRYSTVEEYEAAMLIQARRNLVWEKLIEESTVLNYPKKELNEHTLDFIEYYDNQASAASLTTDQFVAKKFLIDRDSFHLKADEYSKNYTKEELAVYLLARRNGLELTDNEYEQAATLYAKKYGYDTLFEYEAVYGRAMINYTILKDKVIKYVTEHSLSAEPPEDQGAEDGAA